MQQVHRAPPHLAGYLPPDAPMPLPQRPSAPQLAHAEGASACNNTATVTAGEPGERGCAAGAAASAPSANARAEAAPAPAAPEAPASPPVEGSAGARGRGPGTASDRGRAARLRVLSRLDDSQVPLGSLHTGRSRPFQPPFPCGNGRAWQGAHGLLARERRRVWNGRVSCLQCEVGLTACTAAHVM